MKVIWKRPDGFHNASPENYKVESLTSGSKIWLHKTNTEWYPFRVSGDWAKEEGTTRLNQLINLIGKDDSQWISHLSDQYFDSDSGEANDFIADLLRWLNKVKDHLKGDTWELDIMEQVVSEVYTKVDSLKKPFISSIAK